MVCFDIGGVFIRLADGWDDVLKRTGIDRAHVSQGFDRHPHFVATNHELERDEIDQTEYNHRLAGLTGLRPDQILAMLNEWLLEPYPGIDGMLDKLERTGVRTACLSNTNHTHWHAMNQPGPKFLPLHRLHDRFASSLIGHRKPEAAIYQHVQNETGIPPQAILFFDDLTENIHTAQQQGWQAHQIDPAGDPISQVVALLEQRGVL